ncbi:MAG: hypothetical protein R3C68_17075 [Myxococcota bacterium]
MRDSFENGHFCAGPWNEVGHRLAGEKLAENLCQAIEHLKDKVPKTVPLPRPTLPMGNN